MIILDATNKSITLVMDVAATTTNPVAVVSYADITTTTFTPGEMDTASNGTTPVTIVTSPASSTQRQIKTIIFNNNDTIAHIVTVNYVNNASTRQLLSWALDVNETLIYTDALGWRILTSIGAEKSTASRLVPSQLLSGPFNASSGSLTASMTSTTAFAMYLGSAKQVSSSISLRYRVTTLASTITYAEMGIFKGNINLGGNPTLTRLGYADVSGMVNSTGQKTTTVTLTTPTAIGDELWAVYGNQASVVAVLRAGSPDDIGCGMLAKVTARPSTVASPTAWTIDTTTNTLWIKGWLN
jgi:hypothetical protein